MSEADAATSVNVAEKLGFKTGDLIQEFGYDDDVDFDLRDDIEDLTGSELFDEDDHEVVDAAILWWRDGDGDLSQPAADRAVVQRDRRRAGQHEAAGVCRYLPHLLHAYQGARRDGAGLGRAPCRRPPTPCAARRCRIR